VYSGTGDPREVGRLQKMQAQYKKEFKVKKWDDLSIKWTDDEEQALRKAVEKARDGCGFLCVK
jgi:RNA exonuclease 1